MRRRTRPAAGSLAGIIEAARTGMPGHTSEGINVTINVGVIGVGMIGQDHIRRLTQVLSGAAVVAVTDVNAEQAERVATALTGGKVFTTGQELIADANVDAAIVCSWGPTHEEYVLAAIAADKPVFCEKPLATTQEACLRILDAENRARSPASCRSATCGATTTAFRAHEGGRGQRGHRRAVDHAQHTPQPSGARSLHARDGHHGHRGARHRHRPLDARRGDRRGRGPQAPQESARWRPGGPTDHPAGDRRAVPSWTSKPT